MLARDLGFVLINVSNVSGLMIICYFNMYLFFERILNNMLIDTSHISV